MKALVFERPHQAAIKEVPYPVPGPGEVTVKVARVGICGTDLHIYEGGFISPYPIIPGHEFSGIVHELGEGVEGWQVGDRVSADPTLLCGSCRFCLTGKGNQCTRWQALGNNVNGSMAEYVAVPSRNLVKLPDHMTFATGAFIEPMACVVHGMNRLQLQAGDRVLLFGAGAMGQQLVQSIAKSGASELVVVDVSAKKLELAESWGATKGVLSHQIDAELGQAQYPHGFDVVVDVTGIPAVIEKAFDFMGPVAKFLQFGVAPPDATVAINPFSVYHKDWTIIGSMAINNTFWPAFEWLKEGRIDVEPLVSKVLTPEEAPSFFASPKSPDDFKVQIAWN